LTRSHEGASNKADVEQPKRRRGAATMMRRFVAVLGAVVVLTDFSAAHAQ
jgi:hypothetical protein